MFKRLTKFNRQRERDAARGIDIGQDAPPETLMDEDESDSGSDSEGSSDGSDEEEEGDISGEEADEDEEEGDEDSASDDGSDADSDSDASDASGDDEQPPLSISQSLQSPFYISPDSPAKAGVPWTSCLVCPLAQLKTAKAVEVHEGAKAHRRRFERYTRYVAERLTRTERENEFEFGGADPREVVREIEGQAKREAKAKAGKGKGKKPVKAGESKSTAAVQEDGDSDSDGESGDEDASKSTAAPASASASASEKALARRERKKAHKKAWKEEKEAKRLARKLEREGASAGEEPSKQANPKVSAAAPRRAPVTVVFDGSDPSSSSAAPASSRKDWKEFMSSKTASAGPDAFSSASEHVRARAAAKKEAKAKKLAGGEGGEGDDSDEDEAAQETNDRQLSQLLNTTLFAPGGDASSGKGKAGAKGGKPDLSSHETLARILELSSSSSPGAKPAGRGLAQKALKAHQLKTAPSHIRQGLRAAAGDRAAKEVERNRELGLLNSSYSRKFMGEESLTADATRTGRKAGKGERVRGLGMGVGKFKDGTLKLSRDEVERMVGSGGGDGKGQRRKGGPGGSGGGGGGAGKKRKMK